MRYDLAAAAIRKTAQTKNHHPPGLVDIALQKLLEAPLELPALST